jgi:hypothetical protein
MDGTQTTVLSNIMSQFNNKLGAMGPVLAGQPDRPEGYTPQLTEGYNATGYNEARREAAPQYKSSIESDGKTVTIRAYGLEETRPINPR